MNTSLMYFIASDVDHLSPLTFSVKQFGSNGTVPFEMVNYPNNSATLALTEKLDFENQRLWRLEVVVEVFT